MIAIVVERLQAAVPSLYALAVGVPLALTGVTLVLLLCGHLHATRHWRIGDTRKLLHTSLFVAAACVQAMWGLSAVVAMGIGGSIAILYAATQPRHHPLLQGIARPTDDASAGRHRVWHSWLATCLGGGIANLAFGPAAIVGYLVTGLADTAGEAVGSRIGHHRYTIPWPVLGPVTRSYEGSAAVAIASALAIALGLTLVGHMQVATPVVVLEILVLTAICTLAEAASPHGWDNLLLQLLASGGAFVAILWA